MEELNGQQFGMYLCDNGPNEKSRHKSLGFTQLVCDSGYLPVCATGFFETEEGKNGS